MDTHRFFRMAARIGLLGALVLAGAGDALAQPSDPVVDSLSREPPGFGTVHLSKATIGTAEIILLSHAALEPDCTASEPRRPLTVVEPPSHGVVRLANEMLFIRWPADNLRAACNRRKVPGDRAYYMAEPGFRGHDVVVLQQATNDGHVREITVDIEVR
jgi:hypothetical protein